MGQDNSVPRPDEKLGIQEGSAKMYFKGIENQEEVFYNPVQIFNRDLTCTVIQAYRDLVGKDIKIFEAFAGSGIRSIRYSKECTGISHVLCNDLDQSAVEVIQRNVEINGVSNIVTPNKGDAREVMAKSEIKYDVLDLDPYGTAAPFLDSAVQASANGALLCITSTDGRTLCGMQPGTAFSWYGSITVKAEFTHEWAVRSLLHTLISTAARYGKSIEPLLCISANFYVRLFVRIWNRPIETQGISTETGLVFYSHETGLFWLQQLGEFEEVGKSKAIKAATVTAPYSKDPYTGGSLKIGGPAYLGKLHSKEFIEKLFKTLPKMRFLTTVDRIEAVLSTCKRELEAPLYYNPGALCGVMKSPVPPRPVWVTQLRLQGYDASLTHCGPGMIKTNAPPELMVDIIRAFYKENKPNPPTDRIAKALYDAEPKFDVGADYDPDIKEELAREKKICKFYGNPEANFGPKAAAKPQKKKGKQD